MSPWLPLVPLVLLLGTAVWVYRDATRLESENTPVVLRTPLGSISTPQGWTIACVLGWVFFFPLYLVGRQLKI